MTIVGEVPADGGTLTEDDHVLTAPAENQLGRPTAHTAFSRLLGDNATGAALTPCLDREFGTTLLGSPSGTLDPRFHFILESTAHQVEKQPFNMALEADRDSRGE